MEASSNYIHLQVLVLYSFCKKKKSGIGAFLIADIAGPPTL